MLRNNLCHKGPVKVNKMSLVRAFGCPELVLYGIRELASCQKHLEPHIRPGVDQSAARTAIRC